MWKSSNFFLFFIVTRTSLSTVRSKSFGTAKFGNVVFVADVIVSEAKVGSRPCVMSDSSAIVSHGGSRGRIVMMVGLLFREVAARVLLSVNFVACKELPFTLSLPL